jgi:hypothetical protein
VTKSLLGYGVLAGPVYVTVVLAQALTRPGFDLTRHDASLLSNGSLGWIQVANFLVTGAMVVACAIGMGRALAGSSAGAWGSRLLAGFGLGMIGAGLFVADPMAGFPPGTAAGRPAAVTTHGLLHIASGGLGFLCFVAACFLLARLFAAQRRHTWARFSWVTGGVFLAAFAGVASGSSSRVVVLAFWVALLLAWSWLAALAVYLYRQVAIGDAGHAAQPDANAVPA